MTGFTVPPADLLAGLLENCLKAGASAADARIGVADGVSVSVRDGKLESIEREESASVALRCFFGKRQAHVSGADLSPEGMKALTERCVAMARAVPEDKYCGLPERGELEIRFPNLIGYRVETEPARLRADFSAVPKFGIDTTKLPVQSILGTAVSGDQQALELRVDELRDQQVVFDLIRIFMRGMADDAPGRADLRVFSAVRTIVQHWYDEVLTVIGEVDAKWKRLVIHENPVAIVESINRGIIAHAAERERVLPLLNHYNPTGSTANVFGHTAKPTYPGRKSHVNLVVADTDLWEQVAAKHLDRIREVESYVKNAFLGFVIPYVQDGKEHKYLPDYIVRLRTPKLRRANLILEITGFNKDKAIKRWYVRERWLPAVNNARGKLGLPPWYFEEVEDIDNLKPQLEAAIRRIVAEVDAAPDSVGEALDLLARLPADFYVEGREDRPVFEQREPFE